MSYLKGAIPGDRLAAIVDATRSELVTCWGARHTQFECWCPFYPHPDFSMHNGFKAFSLLIVVPNLGAKDLGELEYEVAELGDDRLGFEPMVIDKAAFLRRVGTEERFLLQVCLHGHTLYEKKGSHLLAEARTVFERLPARTYPMAAYRRQLAEAGESLTTAEYYREAGNAELAMAHLHESACQVMAAYISMMTGLSGLSHRLNRLLTLAENYSAFGFSFFPRMVARESKLVRTFDEFVITRKEGVTLSAGEQDDLFTRVRGLWQQAHADCHEASTHPKAYHDLLSV